MQRLRRSKCSALVLGVLLVALPGCWMQNGTIHQGTQAYGPATYGGVRMDAVILGADHTSGASKAMAVIDLPFSFVFDTLLLPISALNEVIAGGIYVSVADDWDEPKQDERPSPYDFGDTEPTKPTP